MSLHKENEFDNDIYAYLAARGYTDLRKSAAALITMVVTGKIDVRKAA